MMAFKIKETTRKIKDFVQKGKRGYSDSDVWNMSYWFLSTIIPMLKKLKAEHVGFPGAIEEEYIKNHKEIGLTYEEFVTQWPEDKESEGYKLRSDITDICSQQWEDILGQMIFCFEESLEETCSVKNPYEKEYHKAFDEFIDNYGVLGQGLATDEEKEEAKRTGSRKVHFMDEVSPELANLSKNYFREERKIDKYREKKLHEGLNLFNKWFNDLWD